MAYFKQFIDFPTDEETLTATVSKAKDFALMHGAGIRSKDKFSSDSLQFLPFVLTPSPFPRQEFERVVDLQTTWNELMHAVAHDDEFLRHTLASTVKADDFTAKLFELYKTVKPAKDSLSIALLRSDYLPHTGSNNGLKQVEINTIASSFGALSPVIRRTHEYVLGELNQSEKAVNLPKNDSLVGLSNGLIRAWEMYGNERSAILFVVENETFNICDQRLLEFQIRKSNVRVIRKTLSEVNVEGSLNDNGELMIEGQLISIVYFRAGYDSEHYPSQAQWNARLLIEKSKAIKCPSINYHLAGTKKVQQVLSEAGTLSRFIKDPQKVAAIRSVCVGLYSLDKNDHTEAVVAKAIQHPEQYVLKPQREGGGHNIYDQDIPQTLKKLSADERSAYILMERIMPPLSKGYILRPGLELSLEPSDLVSELGIFGVIIGTKNKILYNVQAGHILRSKSSQSNETGVNAGLGVLDSPYLFD